LFVFAKGRVEQLEEKIVALIDIAQKQEVELQQSTKKI
jgi:hypothetical protein